MVRLYLAVFSVFFSYFFVVHEVCAQIPAQAAHITYLPDSITRADINNSGIVVGTFTNGSGFIGSPWVGITDLTQPGGLSSGVVGITDYYDVIGYVGAPNTPSTSYLSVRWGFLSGPLTIENIPSLNNSNPYGYYEVQDSTNLLVDPISAGRVVTPSYFPFHSSKGFVSFQGISYNIADYLLEKFGWNGFVLDAVAINDSLQIISNTYTPSLNPKGSKIDLVSGTVTNLLTISGSYAAPKDINNLGEVVGFESYGTLTGNVPMMWSSQNVPTALPLPIGATGGKANFISDNGIVLGAVSMNLGESTPVVWYPPYNVVHFLDNIVIGLDSGCIIDSVLAVNDINGFVATTKNCSSSPEALFTAILY